MIGVKMKEIKIRYGLEDILVDKDVKLPKYIKFVDEDGNEYETEIYFMGEEETEV